MHEVQPQALSPRRLPAQHGRETVRLIARRALLGLGVLIVSAVIAGAIAGWRSWTFVVAELTALVLMLLGDRWLTPRLERRERGNLGEMKVGRILDEQEGVGWRVLHDVATGHGNIDHVLVGPGGILTVETKSRRGRLNVQQLDPNWLRQAYAQRKWIERVTGQQADALLVFSDAFLDRPVSRQRGVCVLPARMLAGHLARRPARLAAEEVESIHSHLSRALLVR